mmetsp:Transcript_3196/g.7535  ORF Transcript_3196/g.7535 Transcript_3196/m.7535 type:complete len:503 (+) Transcript_3196:309-1817(+)
MPDQHTISASATSSSGGGNGNRKGSASKPSYVRILPQVQNYGWGKKGSASKVAQMAFSEASGKIDEGKRYAEMWMGTHFKAPCQLADGELSMSLLELIRSDPKWWLGDNPTPAVEENDLPFLFKVLSFNQASSIQVHPDRELARQLQKQQPDTYDANHKPEIGIPISREFECLCGFRPLEEIEAFEKSVPELRSLMLSSLSENGVATTPDPDSRIEQLYGRLMTRRADVVKEHVDKLVERCRKEGELQAQTLGSTSNANEQLHSEEGNADVAKTSQKTAASERDPDLPQPIPANLRSVILRLAEFYPGDVGIFSVFFLNYVYINRDEDDSSGSTGTKFIFCAANVPHTYLSGDVIECMSLSDNVVRAGLTPKFKDVSLLLQMCDYRDGLLSKLVQPGEEVRLPVPGRGKVHLYAPAKEWGITDFRVYEICGAVENVRECFQQAAIMLFLEETEVRIESEDTDNEGEESCTTFRAAKNSIYFVRAKAVVSTLSDRGRCFVATS